MLASIPLGCTELTKVLDEVLQAETLGQLKLMLHGYFVEQVKLILQGQS